MIASKLDLDTNREVSYYEGAEFAKRIGAVSFNECTRENVMGVNQAFESIANVAVKIQLDKDNTVQQLIMKYNRKKMIKIRISLLLLLPPPPNRKLQTTCHSGHYKN